MCVCVSEILALVADELGREFYRFRTGSAVLLLLCSNIPTRRNSLPECLLGTGQNEAPVQVHFFLAPFFISRALHVLGNGLGVGVAWSPHWAV